VRAEAEHCSTVPPFGYAGAGEVNIAAIDAVLGVRTDLFGANLDSMIVERDSDTRRAVCQLRLAKSVDKLMTLQLGEHGRCVTSSIRNGAASSSAELQACVSGGVAPGNNARVGALVGKLTRKINKKCRPGMGGVVSTECAADSFGECVVQAAVCRSCLAAAGMNALAGNCDALDDGLTNASCAP
jgi:hypothetical protein